MRRITPLAELFCAGPKPRSPSRSLSTGVGSVDTYRGGIAMSILVHFEPEGMTAAQYDKTISDLEKSGDSMKGVEYHACYGTEGDLRVIEVWTSPEEFEAFCEIL